MKRARSFLVNLVFDPEYSGYAADVPQLPGCMSQGKTVDAALRNIREAIRAYLKAAPTTRTAVTTAVLTGQVEVRV